MLYKRLRTKNTPEGYNVLEKSTKKNKMAEQERIFKGTQYPHAK